MTVHGSHAAEQFVQASTLIPIRWPTVVGSVVGEGVVTAAVMDRGEEAGEPGKDLDQVALGPDPGLGVQWRG